MRLGILVALVAGVIVTTSGAQDAAKKELKVLQGEWKLLSATRDGKEMPQDMVKLFKMIVKDETFTITRDGKAVELGKLTLDPEKKPKEIDAVIADTKQKVLGIYELNGDTYKLCYGPPGKGRPKEFAAKEGTGDTLSVWQREKK